MIVGVVILIFCMHNLLITCVALLGMSWFLFKFILGIRLIIDMVSGPCEADTIFTGVFNIERLDIFFSIHYQNIYLNDEKLKKIFMLFYDIYDVFQDELYPGDRIKIVYYKHSRIILQLNKTKEAQNIANQKI